MTIQYASDLHLEFPKNRKFMEKFPLQPAADILILAGDIVPFSLMDRCNAFFDYLNANWEQAYWIPGNHEFYGSDLNFRANMFEEGIRERVTLLNNKVATFGDTQIIFSTLWSHITPANEWTVYNSMNDFRAISDGTKTLSVERLNALHKENVDFIKAMFKLPFAGKTIVVTHHVPTFMYYPEKYKGDALNEAFATELSDLIKAEQPDAWIFGHHHANVGEFKIGATRMLTNQLGYVEAGEGVDFERDRVIEL